MSLRLSLRSPAYQPAALLCVLALCVELRPVCAQIVYEMVTVGNPGNASDTPEVGWNFTYGAVAYEYQIGRYVVTIGQYAAFLNAVAATDTYSLYNTAMGTDLNVAGISRTGASGSYAYSVINNGGDSANRPITYVSWWDAARFSNWMANGQPTGAQSSTTTENGAYNVNGATTGSAPGRNTINPNTSAAPTFYIPTEDEWYKAAFYSPVKGGAGSPGYYVYPTQSDSAPGNVVGPGTNQANCYIGNYPNGLYATGGREYSLSQNYLTDVGAFSGSQSFYGTYDQSGNVNQWNDKDGLANSGSSRGSRGGFWGTGDAFPLSSSFRYSQHNPSFEANYIGFRLASPVAVPEPSTWVMGLAGIACAGWGAWRRRRARA